MHSDLKWAKCGYLNRNRDLAGVLGYRSGEWGIVMKLRRKCFAVLLVIVFMVVDPYVTKAGVLYKQPCREFCGEYIQGNRIRCYLNGGNLSGAIPLEFGPSDLPVELEHPQKKGYNFAGWYTDSGFLHKISRIETEGSYRLYAKWTKCIDGGYNIEMYPYHKTMLAGSNVKKLKNCTYSFLKNVKIPGMPSTRELDAKENRIIDTSQCPQGICIAGDYLLISSYSSAKGAGLGCIHIFERDSGAYLVTLGMKKRSHLGGLAFDGENIWVCHSGQSTLECIPYSFIREMAEEKRQTVVDCSALFEEFYVANTPSCITYNNGMLWVATHTKRLNSRMTAYVKTKDGLLQKVSYRIPDKVQGVAFDEEGRVYISASYGRMKSSYLKVYASLEEMDSRPGRSVTKVEMPPCSEGLVLTEGQIYLLFESAGEKYFEGTDGKGRSISPLDEILVLWQDSIF